MDLEENEESWARKLMTMMQIMGLLIFGGLKKMELCLKESGGTFVHSGLK